MQLLIALISYAIVWVVFTKDLTDNELISIALINVSMVCLQIKMYMEDK